MSPMGSSVFTGSECSARVSPPWVGASGEGRGGHPPPAEPRKDGQLLLTETRAPEEGSASRALLPSHRAAFLGCGRASARLLLAVGRGQSAVEWGWGSSSPPLSSPVPLESSARNHCKSCP